MYRYLTIDKINAPFFAAVCPSIFRGTFLHHAAHYPQCFNGVGVVDANTDPAGLAFTLRNPGSSSEFLKACNVSIPMPKSSTVLVQLLEQLVHQAAARNSTEITASFFESEDEKQDACDTLLRTVFRESGFEEPKPYKIIYKLKTEIADKTKFVPLTDEELGSFRMVSFEEYGNQYGSVTNEQLPPHPRTMTPFVPKCETKISQFLLRNEKITGWCTAQRITPATMCYATLFVDPESEKMWGTPLLIRQVVSLHLAHDYAPFALFSAEVENVRFADILQHRLRPHCSDIVREFTAVRRINSSFITGFL